MEKVFNSRDSTCRVRTNGDLGAEAWSSLSGIFETLVSSGIDSNQPIDLVGCCHWRSVINGILQSQNWGSFLSLPMLKNNCLISLCVIS